jgi:hypothetical protein
MKLLLLCSDGSNAVITDPLQRTQVFIDSSLQAGLGEAVPPKFEVVLAERCALHTATTPHCSLSQDLRDETAQYLHDQTANVPLQGDAWADCCS